MWITQVWGAIKGAMAGLFGGSTSGKSPIETVADIADNYKPGQVTQHNMEVESVKVGDESQKEARTFLPKKEGDSWFDTLVDGVNRLPRPLFAFWAFGELAGLIAPPQHLNTLNPVVLNIIWTVIGFYFGIRTITQDLPKLIESWKSMKENT